MIFSTYLLIIGTKVADRLVEFLKCFELGARVFQTGPLCRSADYDASDELGYIHVHYRGTLLVESDAHKTFRLTEPGLFFYMNPTSHRLHPESQDVETVCASFEFGTGLSNPLARALPDVVLIPLRDLPTLDSSLDLLFREAGEDHCGRQAVLDRLIEVVFIQVLRDLMDRKRMRIGLLAGLADPGLARAINAMHANPAANWPLEALSRAAGMSRARFANRFRDVVGQTPGAYLADWRLAVAQSLLRQGKPVQIIADSVGYGSASALSRAFRARLGCSPRDWLQSDRAAGAQGP